jgi:hypothetical protein
MQWHNTALRYSQVKSDGMCGRATPASERQQQSIVVDPLAEAKIMSTFSKLIFGAAIAAVGIASPALAQYAAHDPSISVHHGKHLRIYNYTSPPSDDTPSLGSRSWVGDSASRPYPLLLIAAIWAASRC